MADNELISLQLVRVKGTEGCQSVACWDRPCRPAGYIEISRHGPISTFRVSLLKLELQTKTVILASQYSSSPSIKPSAFQRIREYLCILHKPFALLYTPTKLISNHQQNKSVQISLPSSRRDGAHYQFAGRLAAVFSDSVRKADIFLFQVISSEWPF